MQIDVSERIETAKRLTREWAERAGYKQPPKEEAVTISQKANNVRRILGASNFGCQDRQVHLLCEALLGESIPAPTKRQMVDYQVRVPFAVGSILVPAGTPEGSEYSRAGIVTRIANSGNAGLRMSNGNMHNNHFQQRDLRPATDEEIDAYFSEFFGLTVNVFDDPQVAGETVEELEIPF